MSADSVTVPMALLSLPPPPTNPPGPDPIDDLVDRMHPVCAHAVDVDEVAAVLEASGINDRVAHRDYAATSVFSLASMVLLRSNARRADLLLRDTPAAEEAAPRRTPVIDTLIRAALYLTPTVVALGAASRIDGRPGLATEGALVFGWGLSQALAYLGYRALGTVGRAGATRLLAVGFGLAALGWGGVLWATAAPWPAGYVVSGAQLTLFAAAAVALVTGTERRVLAAAVPVWLSAGVVAAGLGAAATAALLASLAVMLLVAYRPARGAPGGGTERLRPTPRQCAAAAVHGVVGTGQAVLFVLVALADGSLARLPLETLPLLVGVPLTELLLLWHQRRVADGRATLSDRVAFARHLTRVSRSTVAALSLPVSAGAALAVPALAGHASWPGMLRALPAQPRLATAVLLAGVYALCLVLVAHRRPAAAAILVWGPAVVIAITTRKLPGRAHLPDPLMPWVAGLTLFAVCLPALAAVALAIRDPWSYR